MRWLQCTTSEFSGPTPSPRSGHTAVLVEGSKLVVYGGLIDKKFLNDVTVLDTENRIWYAPNCTGSGEAASPPARAFHVAVAIDCNMFVFGGRAGKKRLGDFWLLDTDTWQWTDLSGLGELPPARDFAAATVVGRSHVVLYGGWDGTRWLSDVHILNTMTLEWRQLAVPGPSPPPRCGHTATVVENRLLVLGGRGGGGPIMGDLWALKNFLQQDGEAPAWTQLKLPGNSPGMRCGHSTSSISTQVLVFGGHGTGGWITRYDVYYDDIVALDRTSVQWVKVGVSNSAPPARAYHTLTRVGRRLLLIGGFDGKTTFGDVWWLLAEDDPLAKQAAQNPPQDVQLPTPLSQTAAVDSTSPASSSSIDRAGIDGMAELRQRLGLPPVVPLGRPAALPNGTFADIPELVELGQRLFVASERGLGAASPSCQEAAESALEHLKRTQTSDLRLAELIALLAAYKYLVAAKSRRQMLSLAEDSRVTGGDQGVDEGGRVAALELHRFSHLKSAQELTLDDVASLHAEYCQLASQ